MSTNCLSLVSTSMKSHWTILQGSVQRKLRWSKIAPIVGYWPGTVALGIIFKFDSPSAPIKGSVQRKLRCVKNSANRWVLAWDCGAGHYFVLLIRRCLVFNVFPFPVSKAKLTGEFYNNRRSVANQCPRLAYFFVFLMLRQYYWRCNSYSANRRSAANIKNPRKSF
jgi:hypothetical protein